MMDMPASPGAPCGRERERRGRGTGAEAGGGERRATEEGKKGAGRWRRGAGWVGVPRQGPGGQRVWREAGDQRRGDTGCVEHPGGSEKQEE